MDKKQVQEALNQIDRAVSQLNANRESHVCLVNDLRLVQQCCMQQFEEETEEPIKEPETEDGGTNIIPISPESDDEDSEGSGDSV